MNKVELMGRLTRDPDIRVSQQGENETKIARYTLAVNRRSAKADSENNADFISCVAFGRAAEFAQKYLSKGIKMVVIGHLQSGRYVNQRGDTVYTTDVVIEEHHFAESKREKQAAPAPEEDGFMDVPDDYDISGLPFA